MVTGENKDRDGVSPFSFHVKELEKNETEKEKHTEELKHVKREIEKKQGDKKKTLLRREKLKLR